MYHTAVKAIMSLTMLKKWTTSENAQGKKSLRRFHVRKKRYEIHVPAEMEFEIDVEIESDFDFDGEDEYGYENDTDSDHGPLMKLPVKSESISIFFSIFPPSISLHKYGTRVLEHTKVSEGVYIHALILLKRMEKQDDRLALTPYSVHRLMITAVMISIKFLEHAWYSNKFYAQVGGVPTVKEINKMEVTMLKTLNYNVFVQEDEIRKFRMQTHAGLFHDLLSLLESSANDFVIDNTPDNIP